MQAGANPRRLLIRAATLVAELAACMDELRTRADNSPPVPAVVERVPGMPPLSSEHAAALLGVKPYTVNEWARVGRIRAWKDSKRGPWHFEPADVAAYKAEHMRGTLPTTLPVAYSSGHDNPRPSPHTPARARLDASDARQGAWGDPQHRRPLGARCTPRRPAGRGRPFAPGSHAWAHPPQDKTRPPEPEG